MHLSILTKVLTGVGRALPPALSRSSVSDYTSNSAARPTFLINVPNISVPKGWRMRTMVELKFEAGTQIQAGGESLRGRSD